MKYIVGGIVLLVLLIIVFIGSMFAVSVLEFYTKPQLEFSTDSFAFVSILDVQNKGLIPMKVSGVSYEMYLGDEKVSEYESKGGWVSPGEILSLELVNRMYWNPDPTQLNTFLYTDADVISIRGKIKVGANSQVFVHYMDLVDYQAQVNRFARNAI